MSERKSSGFGKFLAGAAIGVGLGVLFAPKAGAETRKELKEKMDELVKKVKELDVQEVKDNFLKKIEELKEELADLDKEKVISIARERAEVIKNKVEELIEMAKDAGKPVIEDAANAVKKELAKVTKNVLLMFLMIERICICHN